MDVYTHSIEQFFGFSISKMNLFLLNIVHIYNYFTKYNNTHVLHIIQKNNFSLFIVMV
jgi:hypothetical protein